MAITNVLTESWEGHSRGEIEDALKDKLTQMQQDIDNSGPSQGGETPACSCGLETEDNNAADLEFADSNGNVLMQMKDGHIKTKNFDSRTSGGSQADLSNYYTRQQTYSRSQVDAMISGTAPARALKILVLGNSYSCDSFSYLPFILKESYGIDIVLGVYYRGGAATDDYVDSGYTARSGSDVYYLIDTSTDSSWNTDSSITPQNAVKSNTWDMIVLQQGSADSYTLSKYASVKTLYGLIKADANYDFILGWNINHLRSSQFGTNKANCKTVLDLCKLQPATFVFPYGTAIFDIMDKYKNIPSSNAYMMYNNHLNEGLPCYAAAITNVQALFDRFYPGLSVLGNPFVPVDGKRMGGSQIHGYIISMDADDRYLCQQAAILANKDKFNVNPIS